MSKYGDAAKRPQRSQSASGRIAPIAGHGFQPTPGAIRNTATSDTSKPRPISDGGPAPAWLYQTSQSDPYKSYVYFVADMGANMIKIGYTAQPAAKRFGQLVSPYGGKLEILGIMPGSRLEEMQLHELFAEDRDGRSEWFAWSIELQRYITANAQWIDDVCTMAQYELDGVFRQLNSMHYPPVLLNKLAAFMAAHDLQPLDIALDVGCFVSRVERAMNDQAIVDVRLIEAVCYVYDIDVEELIAVAKAAQ